MRYLNLNSLAPGLLSGVGPILQQPAFARLQSLHLTSVGVTGADLEALAQASCIKQLHTLDISGLNCSVEELNVLLQADGFAPQELRLDTFLHDGQGAAFEAVTNAPLAAKLRSLSITWPQFQQFLATGQLAASLELTFEQSAADDEDEEILTDTLLQAAELFKDRVGEEVPAEQGLQQHLANNGIFINMDTSQAPLILDVEDDPNDWDDLRADE